MRDFRLGKILGVIIIQSDWHDKKLISKQSFYCHWIKKMFIFIKIAFVKGSQWSQGLKSTSKGLFPEFLLNSETKLDWNQSHEPG